MERIEFVLNTNVTAHVGRNPDDVQARGWFVHRFCNARRLLCEVLAVSTHVREASDIESVVTREPLDAPHASRPSLGDEDHGQESAISRAATAGVLTIGVLCIFVSSAAAAFTGYVASGGAAGLIAWSAARRNAPRDGSVRAERDSASVLASLVVAATLVVLHALRIGWYLT